MPATPQLAAQKTTAAPCGGHEALRLLVDGGKQPQDFLEPSGCEEGFRQGIHRSPHLGVGRQRHCHPKRQGLEIEETGLWREDLQPGELVRGIL